MTLPSFLRRSRRALAPLAPLMLGGCNLVVMNPAGDVARQQADLILWSTGLMLLIIVPVIALTVLFAWRYRHTNAQAEYAPDWDHSTGLELVIWAAPLMIVIALGALTWVGTHTLDPYRSIGRVSATKPLAAGARPLEVDVVALDWKWLFIYPEQGIATVNQLVVPVDRQVRFRMTSSSVMNTFSVPAMAGMIYTMPGMETQLHAVLNRPGRFEGRSANYSGAGFSDMTFWTYAMDDAGFDRWVSFVKARPAVLTGPKFMQIEAPSEAVPPMGFRAVQPGLFDRILGMCVSPGVPCVQSAMAHDMARGAHAPVSDRPTQPGKTDGALFKHPLEKGTGPNVTAPRGAAPGSLNRGADANRNMTLLDRPVLPGTVATTHA